MAVPAAPPKRWLNGGIDFPRNEQEYRRWFRNEQSALDFMERLRWPEGFRCPACGSGGRKNRRNLWRCSGCHRQFSVTAGTTFDGARAGLLQWLHACWLIVKGKDGYSALDLQRQLGVRSYETAWAMLHKIRRAMVVPDRERLHGQVEVDDAFIGGVEEGVSGRETYTKSIVLVAVELGSTLPKKVSKAKRRRRALGRVRMAVVPDQTEWAFERFVLNSVRLGSELITDGAQVFPGIVGPWPDDPSGAPRYRHTVHVQKGRAKDDPNRLPHVHRVIALVKRWVLGTHQGSIRPRHLDAYLDEFVFRFNRNNLPRGYLFYRLVERCLASPAVPTWKLYRNVPPAWVETLHGILAGRGFPVVITGGWAVDGAAHRATRIHGDLDLLVPRRQLAAARRYLSDGEFEELALGPGDRVSFELKREGLRVDLHPIEIRRDGSATEVLPDGSVFTYTPDEMDFQGLFYGLRLPCVSPEAQLRRRQLDRERDEERHDIRLLLRVVAGELPYRDPDEEREDEELPEITEQDEIVKFDEPDLEDSGAEGE